MWPNPQFPTDLVGHIYWRNPHGKLHFLCSESNKKVKYIKDNIDHVFNWSVLVNASTNMFPWKVLEAYYIVFEKPTLNEHDVLYL